MSLVFRRSLSLLACLVSSCSLLLVPPLCSSGGTGWRLASALFAIIVAMRVSCVYHAYVIWRLAPRFACVPSVSIAPLPRHGWRGGELVPLLLASFGFLPSAALISV